MKQFSILAVLFLALTTLASASVIINFTALPVHTANGYYVGYSEATINTGSHTFTNFDLICDDFTHTTNFPSGPFTYNVETLTNLSGARFTTNQLNNYRVAAVLVYEFDQNLGTIDPGGYNFALWHLFSPGSAANFGDSATLLANAQSIVTTGGGITTAAYNQFRIFTPTGDFLTNQEFLGTSTTINGTPQVPEPASLTLLGTALLGLGLLKRRKG